MSRIGSFGYIMLCFGICCIGCLGRGLKEAWNKPRLPTFFIDPEEAERRRMGF